MSSSISTRLTIAKTHVPGTPGATLVTNKPQAFTSRKMCILQICNVRRIGELTGGIPLGCPDGGTVSWQRAPKLEREPLRLTWVSSDVCFEQADGLGAVLGSVGGGAGGGARPGGEIVAVISVSLSVGFVESRWRR